MNSHILTNHEVSLLFGLRSRTLRSIKNNFGLMLNCSKGCLIIENQEHWLECQGTNANINTHVKYSYFYGSLQQHIEIVQLFVRLEEEREEQTQDAPSSPVAHTVLGLHQGRDLTILCLCTVS